jgi:hypothetical protein
MGGIIAGFIGGASRGLADAGKMLLADKLVKEREEANFLRNSGLQKSLQETGFTHAEGMQDKRLTSAEGIARRGQEGANYRAGLGAAATVTSANIRAGDGETPTNQIKNVRFLMSPEGGSKSLKEAVAASFEGAKIKHTDVEGNISVAVLGDNGYESIGAFRVNDRGLPEFVPPEGQITRTKANKDERQAVAEEWNESGKDKPGSLFSWKANDPEVKAEANKRVSESTKPGIVASQTDQKLPPAAVKQLKENVVTTFQNGQKWTLENGKPKQVK